MADVFLSYARADAAQADAIAAAVQAGGRSLWSDRQLASGENRAEATERALAEARAVVVAWSTAARESLWVRAQANAALDDGKLVQLSLDGAAPPLPFAMAHPLVLSMWDGRRSEAPWPEVEARIERLLGEAAAEPGGRRPDAGGIPFVPPAERALQGFGQVAILGWTAIAAILLTAIFVLGAVRGGVSGEALGVISLVLLVLAVGLLAVSAYLLVRAGRR